MFKKVLAIAGLLSSVSFGSLSDIPNIQDPEFSWDGLRLEDLYPDTPRPHIDFFGIKHRSYSASNNFAGIADNLMDAYGNLTTESQEEAAVLRGELFYEACLMFKIFYVNNIYSNTTPSTSEAFKRLYWNRINLYRVLIIKMLTAVDNYIESHPPIAEAFQFKELLSNQLTNLTDFYNECINDPKPFEFSSNGHNVSLNALKKLNHRLCTIFSIPIPEELPEENLDLVSHTPVQIVLSRSKL